MTDLPNFDNTAKWWHGFKTASFKVKILLMVIAVIAVLFIAAQVVAGGQSVRVDLPASAFLYSGGETYIGARGSWISDTDSGIFAESPINTVELSCDRSRGSCIEALAQKNERNGNLVVQNWEYQIKSWTPEEIVATLGGRAVTIEIHFNRTKRVVTRIESEESAIEGARVLPAHAHIGDGDEAIQAAKKR